MRFPLIDLRKKIMNKKKGKLFFFDDKLEKPKRSRRRLSVFAVFDTHWAWFVTSQPVHASLFFGRGSG